MPTRSPRSHLHVAAARDSTVAHGNVRRRGVRSVEIVDEMTKYERVYAAVQGDEVDRIPVCFWHHFQPEGSGRMMADATLGFFLEKFDLDFIKIMPDIAYPFPRRSISDANDWRL